MSFDGHVGDGTTINIGALIDNTPRSTQNVR